MGDLSVDPFGAYSSLRLSTQSCGYAKHWATCVDCSAAVYRAALPCVPLVAPGDGGVGAFDDGDAC